MLETGVSGSSKFPSPANNAILFLTGPSGSGKSALHNKRRYHLNSDALAKTPFCLNARKGNLINDEYTTLTIVVKNKLDAMASSG